MSAVNIGRPDFGIITLDAAFIKAVINDYLIIGSSISRLSINDINIISVKDEIPNRFSTVLEAIEHGTPFFDAIAYFTLPETKRPRITAMTDLPAHQTTEINKVSEALAYVYFFLMTRGTPPETDRTVLGTDIPRFLHTTLALQDSPQSYAKCVASFSLKKIDHKWIKLVDLSKLGQQFLSRLALGVAGYRLLMPIALMPIEDYTNEAAVKAANIIKDFIARGYMWNIHPITKNPHTVMLTGSLNEACADIMFHIYNTPTLENLVAHKLLFQIPERQLRLQTYGKWTDNTFADFMDEMFPKSLWDEILQGAQPYYQGLSQT